MEKVFPEISREEELSETVRDFPSLFDKSHRGFKENDAVKNLCEKLFLTLFIF